MKKIIYCFLFLYSVLAALTIIYFDGTGDAGDSVSHFLFAKYAPQHPELYFDHWAKPVFVLLSSPFAQFGFVGMKIFNALTTFFTIFFTYKIVEKLKLRNSLLIPIILVCTPMYFALTFSGLTEPLFALFLTIGIYLLLLEKYSAACILLSFLPFVRSEGLIIIGVLGIYLLVKKQWKRIPILILGHLVYSIAGYFVYHDLLWVFRKIPYAHLSSIYGHGHLTHFGEKLFYFLGLPIYILFCFGLIGVIAEFIRKKSDYSGMILFFGLFLVFFLSHTLFWYFGVFGSMGLIRVFICVIPVIAIITLYGFNFLTEVIFGKFKIPQLLFKLFFLLYIVIFPFTPNHAAINFDRDLKLREEQNLAIEVACFIEKNNGTGNRIISSHPYLNVALENDPFDPVKHLELNKGVFFQLKSGDILVWDNWFCIIETDVPKKLLDRNEDLIYLRDFKGTENGREILFSIYKRK